MPNKKITYTDGPDPRAAFSYQLPKGWVNIPANPSEADITAAQAKFWSAWSLEYRNHRPTNLESNNHGINHLERLR